LIILAVAIPLAVCAVVMTLVLCGAFSDGTEANRALENDPNLLAQRPPLEDDNAFRPPLEDDPLLIPLDPAEVTRLAKERQAFRQARLLEEKKLLKELRLQQIQDAPDRKPTPLCELESRITVSAGSSFSPDGKLVALRGLGGVDVWDTRNRQLKHSFGGSLVADMAFSNDSRLLAAGTKEGTNLWDLQNGNLLRQLSCSTNALAFSPDGKILATGGGIPAFHDTSQLKLWEVETGKLLMELPEPARTIKENCLAFTPDGRVLVCGTNLPSSIVLWNVKTGKRIWKTDLKENLESLLLSTNGSWLVAAVNEKFIGDVGNIEVWDVNTKVRRTLIRNEYIRNLALSPNSQVLSLVDIQSHLKLFDLKTGRMTHNLGGEQGPLIGGYPSFSPAGSFFAAHRLVGLAIWSFRDLEDDRFRQKQND
jgi:WD40 repeat protein